MQMSLTTAKGSISTTKVTLPDFFEKDFNTDLVHQVVVAYQANARQGTKKQKTRSEVSGGGKKPWRQKGTGRARAGTSRSPIWVGGGVTFAARSDRNHSHKINRKMYRVAMEQILAELTRKKALVVVDKFVVDIISTKKFLDSIAVFKAKRALLVTDSIDENLYLSSRNVHTATVIDIHALNPVILMSYDKVIFTKQALADYEKRVTT